MGGGGEIKKDIRFFLDFLEGFDNHFVVECLKTVAVEKNVSGPPITVIHS